MRSLWKYNPITQIIAWKLIIIFTIKNRMALMSFYHWHKCCHVSCVGKFGVMLGTLLFFKSLLIKDQNGVIFSKNFFFFCMRLNTLVLKKKIQNKVQIKKSYLSAKLCMLLFEDFYKDHSPLTTEKLFSLICKCKDLQNHSYSSISQLLPNLPLVLMI